MVNAQGGVHGHPVVLDLRDVAGPTGVVAAAASLHADGVPAVIGAYSSALSIPAAAAVAQRGMVYWETGAVADQLTGQGLPLVFRVGADGADLGSNSASFILQQLAPRLQTSPAQLKVYLVTADDDYARSVSAGARSVLTAAGVHIDGESLYDPYAPLWQPILNALRADRPQVLVLSSHIPDGIAFRRAFVAAGLHVGAFIGTTMAQCLPNFGDALGAEAVGVFASDRPQAWFNDRALDAQATAVFQRFASLWGQPTGWGGGTSAAPTEEGLAGFSAAWALLHDVLPATTAATPAAIAAAARRLDLPQGSLPNGAGVLFSATGQNLRAAAVIWQWQAVRRSVVVWPPLYATGRVTMVPLPA